MKVIGVFLLIGSAIFGVITLSEFSRYQSLVADGNPFAGLVSNSYIYCSGIAMTALLCGIGFMLAPSKAKMAHHAAAAAGKANPYGDMVWDGKHWVAPARQFPPTSPPAPPMV
jgi:hypothetical protein